MLLLLSVAFLVSAFRIVIISEEGIELKLGKKRLVFINWRNVTDIKATGFTIGYLTFFEYDKQIDVILVAKTFGAVMEICSDGNLKHRIESLPGLDELKKRYYRNKTDDN